MLQESKILSIEDEEWIQKHYKKAMDLLNNLSFMNAVHCLSTYSWHSLPRIQLAIIWSGIESLFNVNTEVSFRISLYIANFLHPNNRLKAKETFTRVKQLYNSRSASVHGNKMKGDISELVQESAILLSEIIRRCAEMNSLPDIENLVFGSNEL